MITELVSKRIKKKYARPISVGALGIAFIGGLVAYNELEKNDLTYARYEINSNGKVKKDTRIVFLTDLHEKEFEKDNAELIRLVEEADPDYVLIGGDMISAQRKKITNYAIASSKDGSCVMPEKLKMSATINLCMELAKRFRTFYASGNHEQRILETGFKDVIESTEVRYLDDETVVAGDIAITGLFTDEAYFRAVKPKKMTESYIFSHVGKPDKSKFNILLAHSPLFLEAYASYGADLVLSGHFHGGTVRLPGDVGLMTPQYQFFSDKVVGMKKERACKMIISSGLGTHSFKIRINDKPQVVVVDIKK